jgi:hypothetical protein
MFLQIDPSNGLQTVTDIEFMRDRTQLEGTSITSTVEFVETSLESPQLGDDSTLVLVIRTGDLSQEQTVGIRATDGTYAYSADTYAPFDETLTFTVNDTQAQTNMFVTGNHLGSPASIFYLELYNPSTGMVLGSNSRIAIQRLL